MAVELRCEGTLYGVISDDHTSIEVKCKRRSCGAGPGIIVLHSLSLITGKVMSTQRFKEPSLKKG